MKRKIVLRTELLNLVEKGLHAIEHGHTYLAMTCLEEAFLFDNAAIVKSSLAYCRAANGRDLENALAMAEEALSEDPNNPTLCRNLGRIYLLAGRRRDALNIFRQSLKISYSPELIHELETLGSRKPPVFPSLGRSNPINRYIGLLLYKLGLR